MLRSIALSLALIGALASTGCGRPRSIAAHPALWRAHDADTTVWLLGTIHLLPPGVNWRTPAIDRAIASSDMLVTEIPDADPTTQAAVFLKLARAAGLPPVKARVPAGDRRLIETAASRAGVPLTTLDGMKSWAAAVAIAVGASRESGATRDDAVEPALFEAFAGKRRLAFETLAGQLGLFDALSEPRQRLLLVRSAGEALSARSSYQATLDAWATGDEAAIAASFDPTFRGAPGLEAALLTDRNARWAGWIARRMRQPGTVLVAVGAGHMVGPKSIIAMLRAKGLNVERVE